MNFILTQEELDALQNKARMDAMQLFVTLSKNIKPQKVCVDIAVGPIFVIELNDLKVAIEKSLNMYYAFSSREEPRKSVDTLFAVEKQ